MLQAFVPFQLTVGLGVTNPDGDGVVGIVGSEGRVGGTVGTEGERVPVGGDGGLVVGENVGKELDIVL